MTAPLTAQYATFVAAMRERQVPEEALRWVRVGFTDCVGVMLAGREEPVSRVLRRAGRAAGGAAESRVCLGRERLPLAEAACINATAAHALDWDDYAFVNHPSAVLVPAVLATAEPGGVDGATMSRAYVAGYEVWADLMFREPDHIHSKGWHPTGVFGPVAAAAAASVVLGLDARRAAHALALAASCGAGVMANFGTMAKPLHGGRAAQSGVWAARIAAAGMEAGPAAIEGPTGLLHAVSPRGLADRDKPFDPMRPEWTILRLGLNIKKYPSVGASQRCIDALLGLLSQTPVDPARVISVHPRLSVRQSLVMPFHAATTALEGKFSLEFLCAAALVASNVGLAELTDAFVRRPDVQALMSRVAIETTEELDPDYPGAAPFDTVRLVLDDGRQLLSDPVHRASGHADRPLSGEELWAKFVQGATAAHCPESVAARAFELLGAIDTVGGVGDLPYLD